MAKYLQELLPTTHNIKVVITVDKSVELTGEVALQYYTTYGQHLLRVNPNNVTIIVQEDE